MLTNSSGVIEAPATDLSLDWRDSISALLACRSRYASNLAWFSKLSSLRSTSFVVLKTSVRLSGLSVPTCDSWEDLSSNILLCIARGWLTRSWSLAIAALVFRTSLSMNNSDSALIFSGVFTSPSRKPKRLETLVAHVESCRPFACSAALLARSVSSILIAAAGSWRVLSKLIRSISLTATGSAPNKVLCIARGCEADPTSIENRMASSSRLASKFEFFILLASSSSPIRLVLASITLAKSRFTIRKRFTSPGVRVGEAYISLASCLRSLY